MVITLHNKHKTQILLRSAEVAERMRSIEIGSLYIEEMSYWDEEAFLTFLGRLRDKKGSQKLRTVFTPNGLNHTYTFFIEERSPDKEIIYTSTYENKHLPPEYIKMLEDSYDSNLQRQELGGEFFEANTAQIYYMFKREKHTVEVSESQLPITHVGLDFNVSPMTAVCCNITDDVITVVDEIYLENSNTYHMRDELLSRFNPAHLTIVADSTGDSRKTSAIKTDHQILKEAGFNVARFRNPPVGDRYNCVNNLFEKNKLKVNKNCKYAIRDLEKFYRDNKKPELSHISDALGYLCWYVFPLRKNHSNKHINL